MPRDAAVAGFDNTFEGMAAGLTTYDFNVGALADALLAHVLHPERRSAGAEGTVEIGGVVVGRESTR